MSSVENVDLLIAAISATGAIIGAIVGGLVATFTAARYERKRRSDRNKAALLATFQKAGHAYHNFSEGRDKLRSALVTNNGAIRYPPSFHVSAVLNRPDPIEFTDFEKEVCIFVSPHILFLLAIRIESLSRHVSVLWDAYAKHRAVFEGDVIPIGPISSSGPAKLDVSDPRIYNSILTANTAVYSILVQSENGVRDSGRMIDELIQIMESFGVRGMQHRPTSM